MTYRIEDATAADAVAIGALQTDSWQHTYRGTLPDIFLDDTAPRLFAERWVANLADAEPRRFTLVASAGDRIDGFVAVIPAKQATDLAYVDNLHVRPDTHGQGLGRRLMAEAAARLAALGYARLYLTVARENTAARGFYDRLGGTPTGEQVDEVFGNRVTAVRIDWPDPAILIAGTP